MTVGELWDVVGAGGATALLLIVLVMIVREDLVTGKQYRREVDRAEKLNSQASEVTVLTRRLLDVIEEYTRHNRAMDREWEDRRR